jgi:uncharacterized protein YdhG (YjbR/CyaY superfamily)
MAEKPTTVEQHMASLSEEVRQALRQVQATIHEVVPDGEDCISYAIPAIKLDGKVLMFYAGWAHHVSIYPLPPGSPGFEKRLAPFVAGKGTVKFDVSKPIPLKLVADIVRAHIKRHRATLVTKQSKQTK